MKASIATALVLAVTVVFGAQQPRDATTPAPPGGTGAIAGRLVTDDTSAAPIRRGRVTLTGALPGNGFTTISDDRGQFTFANLAPDRYTLAASRPPYLSGRYGATKPGRPGVPIMVAAGQRVSDVVFGLMRGAAITGALRDAGGRPVAETTVQAMQYLTRGGERFLERANASGGQSDDRGVYRLYGLPPGEYIVAAIPTAGGILAGAELRRTTAEDVRMAMTPTAASIPPSSPGYGATPVFFPGTTQPADAAPVKLAAGDERAGVDLTIDLVVTGRLEGTAAGVDGQPMAGVTLRLFGVEISGLSSGILSAASRPDGTYSIGNLAPGHYTVLGQLTPGGRGAAPGGTAGASRFWTKADVSIAGGEVTRLDLTMRRGIVISGTITFEATGGTPAADPPRSQVGLSPIQSSRQISLGAPTTVIDPTGAFTVSGVTPGPYRLTAGPPRPANAPPPAWTLKSVRLGDKELVDLPFDVPEGGDVAGLALTLTDRVSELSGHLEDLSTRPASDYFVIVFPRDRAYWLLNSRRLRSLRPASDGHFVATDLPPGDYLMAALTDVDGDEWSDPAFLARLTSSAVPVVITEGEKKIQNLRILR
jgi:hypothetical protein